MQLLRLTRSGRRRSLSSLWFGRFDFLQVTHLTIFRDMGLWREDLFRSASRSLDHNGIILWVYFCRRRTRPISLFWPAFLGFWSCWFGWALLFLCWSWSALFGASLPSLGLTTEHQPLKLSEYSSNPADGLCWRHKAKACLTGDYKRSKFWQEQCQHCQFLNQWKNLSMQLGNECTWAGMKCCTNCCLFQMKLEAQ